MRGLRRALWDNVFTHDMRAFDDGLWKPDGGFFDADSGRDRHRQGRRRPRRSGAPAFIPYLPTSAASRRASPTASSRINLSQFPETLIESELFGHRKGAFTGAIDHHQGVFERCSAHGALFLDEIGEASAPIQIKLLHVLQERTFTPLGSRDTKRFAGRVIAATNRPWTELRARGPLPRRFLLPPVF